VGGWHDCEVLPASRLRRLVLLLVLLLAACGGSQPSPTPSSAIDQVGRVTPAVVSPVAVASVSPASQARQAASPLAASPAALTAAQPSASGADWLTYQHDLARSGRTSGAYDPPATRLVWETSVDGAVYAQVLVHDDRAFVVTQNDTLYALDTSSGEVVWNTHVGEPVPRSSLPCGNIDPTGITSTPVIDASAGVLYALAFVQPAHHELFAVDLATGSVRFHRPLDPPGASPLTHQQRAALSLAGGTVYVPVGGLFGDCGDYHGWVLAASASDGTPSAVFQVPTQREGAIWGPAGAAIDSNGSLFVATGNGDSTTRFDYANAVIRLSPDLQMQDWFATSDWAELSRRDADLGSIGPTLLEDQNLIFQAGKTGVGYLLRADQLGNIGGEVFQAPVCNGAYGGTAHDGDMVYVSCRNGLVALRVQNAQFQVVWRGPGFNAAAPTITDRAIWSIDSGNARLYGLDPATGQPIFQAPPPATTSGLPHFLSPSASGGRVFQSRGRSIAAFSSQ
jgi:outer membrane protein assembly factor BamB